MTEADESNRMSRHVTAVHVLDDEVVLETKDGRTVTVPVDLYPRLRHGTPAERENLEIGPYGLHWPDLDEDISIKSILLGNRSGESSRSLQQWLLHRERGAPVPVPTMPVPGWMDEPKK